MAFWSPGCVISLHLCPCLGVSWYPSLAIPLPALDLDALRCGLLGRPGWAGMWSSQSLYLGYRRASAPLPLEKRGFFPTQGIASEPQCFGNGALGIGAPSPESTKVLAPHPTPFFQGPQVGTAVAVSLAQTDTAGLPSLQWAPALPPQQGKALASQPSTICSSRLLGPAQSGPPCPIFSAPMQVTGPGR